MASKGVDPVDDEDDDFDEGVNRENYDLIDRKVCPACDQPTKFRGIKGTWWDDSPGEIQCEKCGTAFSTYSYEREERPRMKNAVGPYETEPTPYARLKG